MPFSTSNWFKSFVNDWMNSNQPSSTLDKRLLIEASWSIFENSRNSTGEIREWYDFLSFLLALDKNVVSYSQIYQDLWVLFESSSKSNGYFVEFGALDGVTFSNTFLLEKEFNWTGILCEPNPDMHQNLINTRKSIVDTRCVYSETGKFLEFDCTSNPELSKISSISADNHSRQVTNTVLVETITLTKLLDDHNAPNLVDFLSIDTEGSEYSILTSHDWGRYNFKTICLEHNNNEYRHPIYELLTAKGYTRKFEGFSRFDDWYIFND